MKTYRIMSTEGLDFGLFQGDTPEEAWEAMVQDAGGHTTDEEGHDTVGTPADWIIKEVDE